MKRLMRGLLTCSVLALMSGLSLAEDKPVEPVPAKAAPAPICLAGTWSGTWLSHSNGHDGPIEARFVKLCDDQYQVHFEGRFWGLFPFAYDVTLDVTDRKDGVTYMSGSSSLGLLFGTFTYNAEVTETEFVASYCSKDDHGVFSMARCTRCCCE